MDFSSTPGGQDVHIGYLAVRGLETVNLDKPLFDQFLKAVIELAEADAYLLCHLALGQIGIVFQKLENPVSDFLIIICIQGLNA